MDQKKETQKPQAEQQKHPDEPGATVDEQIEDSFPASDPPSYNAGGRVGQPDREPGEREKEDAGSAPQKK